jgi:hypothetical protein
MPAERVKRWSVEFEECEEGRERGLGEREGEKGGKAGTSGLLLEQGTRHTMGEREEREREGKLGGAEGASQRKGERETGLVQFRKLHRS